MLPDYIESQIMPEPNSGCWLWVGTIKVDGYGMLPYEGKNALAHRIVYSLLCGKITKGLQLDHLCRMRCCVNPDHLEPVTHRINQLRGIGFPAVNAKKTHCPQGHPYDEKNTRYYHSQRICCKCARQRSRLWELRNPERAKINRARWKQKSKKQIAVRRRAHYLKNIAHFRAYGRAYYYKRKEQQK